MYNNIEPNHACKYIGEWLYELVTKIGKDFPVKAIIDATNLTMRNNIFE